MYKGLKSIINPQDEPGAAGGGKSEVVEMFDLSTKQVKVEDVNV